MEWTWARSYDGSRSAPALPGRDERWGVWGAISVPPHGLITTAMQEEPTSLRIEDPGVRALFTEDARFQSWLDVEAALAQAQAEQGIIPESAAREITRKAHLSYLDRAAITT